MTRRLRAFCWVHLGWLALVSAEPAPPDTAHGYWLSVQLAGPSAGQAAARRALGAGLDAGQRDTQVQGIFVGHVADPRDALAWVGRHAFDGTVTAIDPAGLDTSDAPIVGGRMLADHGVILGALVVTGATSRGGRRPIDWPADATAVLPKESTWIAADLVVDTAPLFAAPAAVLPPAGQRHALARRSAALYVLGHLDRCRGQGRHRTCLRWAQVVVRDDEAFVPGYLPAFMVAPREAWRPDTDARPRAALLRSGVRAGMGQWLVLARDDEGRLHRSTVEAPMKDQAFPAASVRIEGGAAIVEIEGVPTRTITIEAQPASVEPVR